MSNPTTPTPTPAPPTPAEILRMTLDVPMRELWESWEKWREAKPAPAEIMRVMLDDRLREYGHSILWLEGEERKGMIIPDWPSTILLIAERGGVATTDLLLAVRVLRHLAQQKQQDAA